MDVVQEIINRSTDWTGSVRQFSVAPIRILSSTNTTPIVVTTDGFANFANGDTAVIAAHSQVGANGTWIVDNVTGNSFALVGSTGTNPGGNTGYASHAVDASGCTVTLVVLSNKNDVAVQYLFTNDDTPTSPLLDRFTWRDGRPAGTFTWDDVTTFRFRLQFDVAETANIYQNSLYGLFFITDSQGVTQEVFQIQFSIVA